MQRINNPYVKRALSSVELAAYNSGINIRNQAMSVKYRAPLWNRGNEATKPVIYTPPVTKVSAVDLKVGDVIEMPTVQRLIIKEIKSGSEGAVVVGEPVLVIYADGYGGVFNDAEAMPIAIPVSAKINLVSSQPQTTASDAGDMPSKN